MTSPEKPSSSTTKPESTRPNVDMVFETLLGSAGSAPKEKR